MSIDPFAILRRSSGEGGRLGFMIFRRIVIVLTAALNLEANEDRAESKIQRPHEDCESSCTLPRDREHSVDDSYLLLDELTSDQTRQ